MTYQGDFTLPRGLLEQIAAQGFDVILELIRVVVNAAMEAERQQYLKAAPYQHSAERQGHANGFKEKTVKTRLGEITFDLPQVRDAGFYLQALEKGLRSERALTLTFAEMYVQGVVRLNNWTGPWRVGASVHWVKFAICLWMHAMKRYVRMGKSAI